MNKEKRSENWLSKLRNKTTKPNSSSNTKANSTSSANNVGSKADKLARPSNTSSCKLHDDIYTCPLSIYIDVTTDDNKLPRLLIHGKATQTQLEEARFKLLTDFSEVSNAAETQAYAEVVSNLSYQRNLILGYQLSLQLVLGRQFQKAIEYLNQNGLKCTVPSTDDQFKKLVESIDLKIKNRIVKYKEAQSQYKALSSGKGDKPTRRYYNKLLVMLSTCECIKMQLNPKEMTIAEFAEYLNLFNEYQNHLKMRNHGQ